MRCLGRVGAGLKSFRPQSWLQCLCPCMPSETWGQPRGGIRLLGWWSWTEGTENKGQNPLEVPPASLGLEGSAFPTVLDASIASEVWRFFLNYLFLCDSQEVPAEDQGTRYSFLLSQPTSSSARWGINCNMDKLAQPGSGTRLFRPAALPLRQLIARDLQHSLRVGGGLCAAFVCTAEVGDATPRTPPPWVERGRGGMGTGAAGWPWHPKPLPQGFFPDGLCSPE